MEVRARLVRDMVDAFDAVFIRGEDDLLGFLKVFCDQALRLSANRCGEKQDLTIVRALVEDGSDILVESHREHLVGFVEDRGLQCGEIEVPTLDVIFDPSRGSDDDCGTLCEGLFLRIDR